MKPYLVILCFMLVLFQSIAKEQKDCKLSIEPKRAIVLYPGDYKMNSQEEFAVLSYSKKNGTAVAYNEHCVIKFAPVDLQIKAIKSCGIKDLENKNPEMLNEQIKSAETTIFNNDYCAFRKDSIQVREAFLKDSLEKRTIFVKDSLEVYQTFLKDSLQVREEFVQATLYVDSIRAEFESTKAFKEKKDKEFWSSKGSPVAINMVYWESNSVGGITAKFEVLNLGKKTIKYVAISGYFKNAVGDRVYNQIGRESTYTVRGIGPIGPAPTSFDEIELFADAMGSYEFDDCFFYSRTANSIEVSSVKLTFTDGTTQTVSGKILEKQLYWKSEDLIDSVYGYKNYIEYLKSYNKLDALLSEDLEYTPKQYEPIEYVPLIYTPSKFNFKNY